MEALSQLHKQRTLLGAGKWAKNRFAKEAIMDHKYLYQGSWSKTIPPAIVLILAVLDVSI